MCETDETFKRNIHIPITFSIKTNSVLTNIKIFIACIFIAKGTKLVFQKSLMILHQFQLHPHLQQLSDLLVGEQEVKGMSGQQTVLVDMVLSAMTTGTTMMQGLFVDNLDSLVVLLFMVNC